MLHTTPTTTTTSSFATAAHRQQHQQRRQLLTPRSTRKRVADDNMDVQYEALRAAFDRYSLKQVVGVVV